MRHINRTGRNAVMATAVVAAFACSRARAADTPLYELCMLDKSGFAVAAPCMSKHLRDAPRHRFDLMLAARIDELADQLRAGRITERQAVSQFIGDYSATDIDIEKDNHERCLRLTRESGGMAECLRCLKAKVC